jgi:hypothetical protein
VAPLKPLVIRSRSEAPQAQYADKKHDDQKHHPLRRAKPVGVMKQLMVKGIDVMKHRDFSSDSIRALRSSLARIFQ